MQIELGLLVPATSTRTDVLVRAPAGTTLGDVALLLLSRVLPAGATGRLCVDGRQVSPGALLFAPPLVHGALLCVDAAAPAAALAELLELHVVNGPDAGSVHRLSPGDIIVGRDSGAAVRLDDADVSRAHCRVRISHSAATVTDLGSANGSTVDGVQIEQQETALPIGSVLRVGQSSLVLASPSAERSPLTTTGDGRRAFNRPPRLREPRELVQVVVPFPPQERERSALPLLAMLAPLLFGLGMWRLTGGTSFLLFTLLSPLMLMASVVTDRRSGSRRRRRELALWRAQREVAQTTLTAAVRADEQARRAAHPDPAGTLLTALGPGPRLWERRRGDDDLLELRLGLADQPARVEAEGDLARGATTARSVPLLLPLREVGVLGIAGDRPRVQALARWIVAQTAATASPRDLQIVVLAEPSAAAAWQWVRWLPHTLPDTAQDCRVLLGLTTAQATARVRELTAQLEARREEGPQHAHRRLTLVVLDGARSLRDVPRLTALLEDGPALGIVTVCLEQVAALLPEECGATAVLHSGAALTVATHGRPALPLATADLVSRAWAERLARALAPLRDETRDSGGADDLPTSLRWTDLVGLHLTGDDSDAAQVAGRWSSSGRSTSAALGHGPDGAFTVDLSRDGPHALVAGTTGSGKSELLQTLVASLALANRPDELTFVLVDYKGGAAFGPCARLPHTVGMVTDLDGTLVERALASLRAELARREAVLADADAKDIEDHRRRVGAPGGPVEPLARLVIVVDEFASLVEDLPDFVGGLVGIAMRGRSLGVHLVLATQRPEGVVSADIRANTNLRLCLAVTRDSESRDVLDSPLAARIPRSRPGRAYARTGHTELNVFQAARVGGRRPAVNGHADALTVELLPAAELGDPLPRAPVAAGADDDPTDLDLLVDACVAAAARLQVRTPKSPWLPPLPELVVLADLPRTPDPLVARPGRVPPVAWGLVDVPGQQEQRPLTFDLDSSTHLLVVGAQRTGRTTALRTLAAALAGTISSDDVHLYALDPGGSGLVPLTALPHTGAVVTRDQPERLNRVLDWLCAEVLRRQAQLASAGHADLAEQRAAATAADRLPHLVLLLDRWEAFLSAYQDLDAGRLVEQVYRLLREGPSVGLHVVLTCDRSGLVGRLPSMIEETLLLRLADRGDYGAAGLPTRLVPATLPPGRGWSLRTDPLVAQVALLDADPSGPAQVAALDRLVANLPAPQLHRPRRVEALPASVRLDSLPACGPDSVLIGVGGDELEPIETGLGSSGFLIGGPPGSGRSTTLVTLAEQLRGRGLPVVAVAPRPSPLRGLPGLAACVTDRDGSYELEGLTAGPVALLIDDAELLVDSGLAAILERVLRESRDSGSVVVAAGTTEVLLSGYRGFVVDLRRSKRGLLLSPQSAADGDLLGVRLSRATGGAVQPGRGLLVARGQSEPVQVALPTGER